MAHIYNVHGLPGAIVPDHDPVFTSKFWRGFLLCRDGIEDEHREPPIDERSNRACQPVLGDLPPLLYSGVSQEMELLAAASSILAQHSSSRCHWDATFQGHVWQGPKALGDYNINRMLSSLPAILVGGKNSDTRSASATFEQSTTADEDAS